MKNHIDPYRIYIVLFVAGLISPEIIWKPLWAFQRVHHSTMRMNLAVAYRLNGFFAIVSPLFFIPAALLGMPPGFIVVSYAFNLAYQFLLHTEAVGRLGPIEKVMDTPSSHRVHHRSNPIYIDKNFGEYLLSGTGGLAPTSRKPNKVIYGLTTGFLSQDSFRLVLQGFIDLFRPKSPPKPIDSSTPDSGNSPEK
ncbi:sterol desaturase family protein [Spirosoma humi]